MSRRLSSITTPFYKAIPFIFVPYGLSWLFYPPRSARLGGIIFLFLLCAVWFLFTFRWKSVHLKGDVLSVSNYLKRIKVPLADVESVEASSWWGWHPRTVTVRLRKREGIGGSVVFVAREGGMAAGIIAGELQRLIEARR